MEVTDPRHGWERGFVDSFIAALDEDPVATRAWNQDFSGKGWTTRATAALVKVIKAQHTICAAIGHHDDWGQSEYLGLDVIGYDSPWGPPRTVVEHENSGWKPQYSVWKLLSVDAAHRVLVAYVNPRARGRDGAEFLSNRRPRTVDELHGMLRGPFNMQRGKRVLVLAGHYWTPATDAGFADVFRAKVLEG